MAHANLGGDLRAAGRARVLARETLTRWGLDPLVDDVLLVVSELVGNALRHGLPPVGLKIWRDGQTVFVTVRDCGPGPLPAPRGQRADEAWESGRGLSIVATLSGSLEWARPEAGSGKAVTAAMTVPAGATSGLERLSCSGPMPGH